ncbi:hypothetical protein HUT16_10445 [Kitasatospora sp. NA04385]|uniref:hypothetical protein n=1 Tax=Kitasatospora sp. NA04385 TaxID=2742135 RepID=UPI0015917C25|nr:hypothetical protein [Kitasatospora sp. NA04385]QKW19435.1 hypothetical protein HUT16_10445 [Kitasatospora sp. NA04385]
MRNRPRRTAVARCVLLGLPVLLAVTGCRAAGALEDAGAARPVRSYPSPQPLWSATAPAVPALRPEGAGPNSEPPVPLPGLVLDALTGTDARTVLAADPGLAPDERAALAGGCAGCGVRPAQYRDLDGDGGPELLTAVLAGADPASPRAVLHVYALREHRVLPVLAVVARPDFTAETVGTDLVVHEPTAPNAETSRTYRWSTDRLVLVDQRIKVTGPNAGFAECLLTRSCDSASVVVVDPPEPTPVPSPAPAATAGGTARTAAPGGTAPAAVRPAPTRTR